ncbi:MAG TPA: hypothetical protein VFH47_07125, partial [Candidatus Thermoplasmatota archaeon]|nr:hypothetical protein [Candidatus Thermoplasmatota archaeon]
AVSEDGGVTFQQRTFVVPGNGLRHFYVDANKFGSGALVVWAVDGSEEGTFDWYTGHVQIDAEGFPTLQGVTLAIDDGPRPSAHVTGAAIGPDGRAYLAMFERTPALGTPLSVFVQQDGPTLPVRA